MQALAREGGTVQPAVVKDILRYLWRAWKYRLESDRAEISKIFALLRPGDLAADIGAHKGAYTYWLARAVGLSGKVEAFEPQPALATSLAQILPRLGIVNTTVHPLALSDHTGKATLRIPRRGSATPSATLEPVQADSGSGHDLIEVPLTTLDEFFRAHPFRPLRLIKCDAEGHELEIFRGGQGILRDDGPALIFECEARHHSREQMDAVFDFLTGLGYRGAFFWRGDLWPLEDFVLDIHQREGVRHRANNFLFIKDR